MSDREHSQRHVRALGFDAALGERRQISISIDTDVFDLIADQAVARAVPFAAIVRELLKAALAEIKNE